MMNPTMKRIVPIGIILFSLLLLLVSLYSDGPVGLSDNGDFGRVMTPNRISYINPRIPFVFERFFKVTYEGNTRAEKLYNMLFTLKEPYYTTQNVFIKLSLIPNLVSNLITGTNLEHYDIAWLGFIYLLAYIGAIALIVINIKGPTWFKISFGITLSFIFCDIGYTAYFNSFYGEPLQLVAMLWILAGIMGVISSEHKIRYILVFYVGVVFFSGAKYANIPMGILLSVAGFSFFLCIQRKDWQKFLLLSLLVFSILGGSLLYENVPQWMDDQTTYQSVFYGILKGSPSPESDLKQLGLPEEYKVLANTNAYMDQYTIDIKSPEFKEKFYNSISKLDILKFYVRNPGRFIEKLRISLLNSGHIRPVYLSNYGIEHERLKFKENVGVWSSLRLVLPFNNIIFASSIFLLSTAIVVFGITSALRKKKVFPNLIIASIFYMALIIINLMNLAVPVIANGEADLQKHMFAFVMGYDLQILILVFYLVRKMPEKIRQLWSFIKKRLVLKLLRYVLVFITAIIALTVTIAWASIKREASTDILAPGSIIYFGSMPSFHLAGLKENRAQYPLRNEDQYLSQATIPIPWIVINKEGTTIQILAKKSVAYLPFSHPVDKGDANRIKYGSNFWPESKIRHWLNTDFLSYFTSEELKLVKTTTNWCILSKTDKTLAQRGHNDFFWTHVPSMAGYGAENAYSLSVQDKFFLPDVVEFSQLISKPGLETCSKESYWLETPYYINSSMVRIVEKDGYVYMKDAFVEQIGVRPTAVLDISNVEIIDGVITMN